MANKIITRTLHTANELHIREAAEGKPSRTITRYAILFNTPAAPLWEYDDEVVREEIAPEAVTPELLAVSDIKMTMFHDRQLILARSNKGSGTLSYGIDERGVYFEFEAPHTADGDKALELVKRGDIAGCSFAFSTYYFDDDHVERSVEHTPGKTVITNRVKVITGIYDFTLAADPAYPDTSCELRELLTPPAEDPAPEEPATVEEENKMREQVDEMRRAATLKYNV